MFRLTVSRRLALIIVVTALATMIIAWAAIQQAYGRATTDSLEALDTIAAPMALAIDADLGRALQQLEAEAATVTAVGVADTVQRLGDSGFVGTRLVDPLTTDPPIEVTTNFLQRASAGPAIGSTRVLAGRVAIVMGAPVVEGDQAGDVVVTVYDVGPIIDMVRSPVGDTEALLAVRNSDDQIAIFTPARSNGGRPVGVVDADTAALVEEAAESESVIRRESAQLLGDEAVVVMTWIDSARWVLILHEPVVTGGIFGLPIWVPALLTLVVVASLWPVFVLRRRLKNVVLGATQLSRGQLAQQLVDDGDDEIGQLARTLVSVDDRLQLDTEQRGRSAAMLQHRATHDPLTGLANRSRLMEDLAEALRTREPVAVLFCDIDDFKGINDNHGHEGGDLVLKHVADQLATACGPRELLARFGGDEFCVLSRTEATEARALARRVERALDTSCVLNDTQQKIGGSVGLAVAKVTDTPDSLLKSADLAMYREKERRRGLRRSRRAEDRRETISPEQIRLVYQPVVELIEQRIVGVEVLARYMHPELGQLDPSSFLPPGTERGVFDTFDLEIMTRSIDQLTEWLEHGVVDDRFTLSMNLAPDHVSDTVSARRILDIVRQRRVPASMVQIEVTEHKLHAHEDDLIRSLTTLREHGIKVAIDDFGVEGSNVDRLVQIPSDVVKIDRSFVSEIDVDERAENRLRAIFEIVTTEGRIAIAEGVERQAQARVLRHLGVPYGQGYLWHAPISALALTPLLGRASRWSRKKPAPQVD